MGPDTMSPGPAQPGGQQGSSPISPRHLTRLDVA